MKLKVSAILIVLVFCVAGCSSDNGNVSQTQSGSASSDETSESSISLADMVDSELYAFESMGDTFAFVVVTNNSDVAVDIDTNITALDPNGEIIGAYSFNESCIAPGQSYPLWHYFEGVPIADIENYDYSVTVNESKRESVIDENLVLSVENMTDTGVIVQATNNNGFDIQYLHAYALFFNNGELVGFGDTFIENNSSDTLLTAGSTVTKQIDSNSSGAAFDDVKVYFRGSK